MRHGWWFLHLALLLLRLLLLTRGTVLLRIPSPPSGEQEMGRVNVRDQGSNGGEKGLGPHFELVRHRHGDTL